MTEKSRLVSPTRQLLPILWVGLLALTCTACGMNLRSMPTAAAPGIAGQWQLQNPPRDELASRLRAVMEQAQAKQEKQFRREFARRAERDTNDVDIKPPEPDGTTAGNHRLKWQVRELHAETDALLNMILPVDRLNIVQAAQRMDFTPAGGARRSFDMGVTSTLVSSYVTLRIESGWQGSTFVVHSRDVEQGVDIVERYQRKDNQLQLQVEFKVPEARTQRYVTSYIRKP